MKKILYIKNSTRNIDAQGITSFNYAAYKAAIKMGMEFHVNTNSPKILTENNDPTVHLHVVEIYRNPLSKDILLGYRQLIRLLRSEKFDAIHCNTPIGGFLGRICGKKMKVPKIIYQAHGLHFYRGAPIINWLLFYPIEKWLARYTDAIITINQDDYRLSRSKFHLRNLGHVYYVPGVGIDLSKIKQNKLDLLAKRRSLGINPNDIILISAGRLDKNKNNKVVIEAIADIPEVKLLLCGDGEQKQKLMSLVNKLNIKDRVLFLGNRTDIFELYQLADIFVLMSYREGLSRSIMEAMASGLPCIVSKIRGNVDLIKEGYNGFLCNPNDIKNLQSLICNLKNNKDLRVSMGEYNKKDVCKYDISVIIKQMISIYEKELF